MMEDKSASDLLKETFDEVIGGCKNYCEWILENMICLELIEDQRVYQEENLMEGIPIMDLTMRF